MGFNCGIIGLPNAGKSTIFNAMTSQHVPTESYPFCTKDHNTGVVAVPDERLERLGEIFQPEKLIPTYIEFVDIAGLVKNAHAGEGLGNRFLHHISEVDAIIHVVRCFDNNNVSHVEGRINPADDVAIINTELLLSDLEKVTRNIDKIRKAATSGDKSAKEMVESMEKAKGILEKGEPIRCGELSDSDLQKLSQFSLLSTKPVLYVANANETDLRNPSASIVELQKIAKDEGSECISICGSIESELVDLSEDEKKEFLDDLGLRESGLRRLINAGYKLLDFITFFTKESREVRAWTVKKGTGAAAAAGKIHTDFEKGFIRAEVYSYDKLITTKSEHLLKESGNVRQEGRDYEVRDGDIIQFKFNV